MNRAYEGMSRSIPLAEASQEAAATGDRSNDILPTIERVIGAFVASVAITALAAMALPGIGGLLATCAAGARIGYRQAKVGATLPAMVTRFAGTGPLGVVRSGSRVELRASAHRASHRPKHQLRVLEDAV